MRDVILASNSFARKNMLNGSGVVYRSIPADIIEDVTVFDTPESAALAMAKRKAVHISQQHPEALVIGSDQVGWFDSTIMSKAKTAKDAVVRLQTMSGKMHALYSGVCVAMGGQVMWQVCDHVELTMHDNFDDDFWVRYRDVAGDVLTSCVGGYAYEAHGAWLFDAVKGDYFTILGMPLKPLLHYLRTEHGVMP